MYHPANFIPLYVVFHEIFNIDIIYIDVEMTTLHHKNRLSYMKRGRVTALDEQLREYYLTGTFLFF